MTSRELQELKEELFEIYAVGFQDGMSGTIDIVTAYNNYWSALVKLFKQNGV